VKALAVVQSAKCILTYGWPEYCNWQVSSAFVDHLFSQSFGIAICVGPFSKYPVKDNGRINEIYLFIVNSELQ
jgi:hypothetical protein